MMFIAVTLLGCGPAAPPEAAAVQPTLANTPPPAPMATPEAPAQPPLAAPAPPTATPTNSALPRRRTRSPGGPSMISPRGCMAERASSNEVVKSRAATQYVMRYDSDGDHHRAGEHPDGRRAVPTVIVAHGYCNPDTYWSGQTASPSPTASRGTAISRSRRTIAVMASPTTGRTPSASATQST